MARPINPPTNPSSSHSVWREDLMTIWLARLEGLGPVRIGKRLADVAVFNEGFCNQACGAVSAVLCGRTWRQESEVVLASLGFVPEWQLDERGRRLSQKFARLHKIGD